MDEADEALYPLSLHFFDVMASIKNGTPKVWINQNLRLLLTKNSGFGIKLHLQIIEFVSRCSSEFVKCGHQQVCNLD